MRKCCACVCIAVSQFLAIILTLRRSTPRAMGEKSPQGPNSLCRQSHILTSANVRIDLVFHKLDCLHNFYRFSVCSTGLETLELAHPGESLTVAQPPEYRQSP